MGRILQLQCDSGISGDMVVGALLDAGANEQGLRTALESLGLDGFRIAITRKQVGPFVGCDFDVVLDEAHENHDHDMRWLYDERSHHPGDGHDGGHGSGHDHHHRHHEHHHAHRNLADVRTIIERAQISQRARMTALSVFGILAEAEAKAHGATVETVHFHEVGAIDSIVDVVAAAWCLDDLDVEDVAVSPLAEGEGHIWCAHGLLPIPVPAVTHIVESYGLVMRRAHRQGELVTPTGAAIAAAIRSTDGLPDTYRIVASGVGCGKRAYDPPSSVRAVLVERTEQSDEGEHSASSLWKLETEVDDCTGEALGFVLDCLYEEGALEAHFLPTFMKKGRPGYRIEVLCESGRIGVLEDVLFTHTTTIGIRRYSLYRTALVRQPVKVPTRYGDIQGKAVQIPGGGWRIYPEHESVAQLVRDCGISYQEAMREALDSCESCQLSTI